MIRRPQRSTQSRSSAASDVYKRQVPDLGEVPTLSGDGNHLDALTDRLGPSVRALYDHRDGELGPRCQRSGQVVELYLGPGEYLGRPRGGIEQLVAKRVEDAQARLPRCHEAWARAASRTLVRRLAHRSGR